MTSKLEKYREQVEVMIDRGMSISQIHEALADGWNVSVGLSTVGDFIRKCKRERRTAQEVSYNG